ncbi:hypothetical protein KW787_01335 [Candidatus Pacearchaeota archaeon]|nr:hypothetical protein [Candidatus Pacearchaeota archaeon]
MLVKVLGAIDLVAAASFLMMIFGIHVLFQVIVFCGGLLLAKGMFVVSGDILSVIDILSSLVLFGSLIFSVPIILLWIPAFLLLAKGFVSFL